MTRVLHAGYKLRCNVCGDKVAVFVIEAPAGASEVSKALKRQEIEVTIPNHKGHELNYLAEQARRSFSYERRMKLFSTGATNAEVVRIMSEEI